MQEEAINALKEIRVRIDEANHEYDELDGAEQLRQGEEVWLACVESVRNIVRSYLPE